MECVERWVDGSCYALRNELELQPGHYIQGFLCEDHMIQQVDVKQWHQQFILVKHEPVLKKFCFSFLLFFYTLSTYQCPMAPKLATVQIRPNYLFNIEVNARVSLMFFLSLLTFRSSALRSSMLGQFTRRQTVGLIPLRPFQPGTDEARLHQPWTELL